MGTDEIRRRYDRKKYNTDIIFTVKGRAYAGELKDVSMGGAFVLTQSLRRISKGVEISISIPFTNGQKNVTRQARAIWKNWEGFAIEFI